MARPLPLLGAAFAFAGLAAAAFAVTPPAPPAAQPRPYEPPRVLSDEDPSCLAETVTSGAPDAEIHLRNACALRVNFALCVRRADETTGRVTTGSLSPADVYSQTIKLGSASRTFHHQANFCPGLTCQVTTPTC